MPEQRNYRFAAGDLMVGTPEEALTGVVSPSGTGRATTDAVRDVIKDPAKAIDGILEQGRQIASNKQKLISTIIKPMKGLDDKPSTPGTPSPAELEADRIISLITAASSISEDAAIAMIVEVWPTWQSNGNTWDTFIKFIGQAASTFRNPQDVIEWSKKLFESMQDGAPVFTPEYIMAVALDGIRTRNFTNYQNLLLSLPFYKSVWTKQPVDTSAFSKAVSQIGTLMQAIQTPTEEMQVVLENMRAKNDLITSMSTFYKSMVDWVQKSDTRKMLDAANLIKNRNFQTGALFERLIEIEMQKKALRQTIGDAIRGLNVVNPQARPMQRQNSHKLFKKVFSAGGAPASGPGGSTSAPATSAGSGTSSTTTSTTGSGTLSPAEQAARAAGNLINRKSALIEQRQRVIENNLKQINNISEQKAKGLSGDLGLFSSLVTSGNVVKKIDETLNEINTQETEIKLVESESIQWINNPVVSGSEQLSAQADTISLNEMRFKALRQDLGAIKQDLKIQRIVLPKELEYFELKEEYDTNKAQLDAPISALMVNNLTTTTNSRGKTTTVNTRVTRPIAIKNTWETGKKIVNLLMQISQALQAGTNHSPTGESMAKNASNYYKAAVKQEVENNKMLMENLAKTGIGGGQVNYTPVAVGKERG